MIVVPQRAERPVYVVIVETQVDVEERLGKPAFLERIGLDTAGRLEREPGLEIVDYENRRALAMVAMPGEVFHARRWWRTDTGDTGGEIWFTLTEQGDVRRVSEDQAIHGLRSDKAIPSHEPATPDEVPVSVFCRPASLSGKAIIRGRL